jgi:rubredoxin
MKCSLCGFVFDEAKAQDGCKHCPSLGACKLIRCPNCGYETPPEPKWLKTLFGKGKKSDENK